MSHWVLDLLRGGYVEPKGGVRQRLNLSFSGGKTSAYMTKKLLDRYEGTGRDITITFSNTGREHPETLEFVHRCDQEMFGRKVIWLEAEVHHMARKGATHRVVSYETADREGKVFEEVIKKYGLPNQSYLHCNREMKINTMRSYLRSIGWHPNTYSTAVGIRYDEMDRISLPAMASGVFYPCVDNRVTKKTVRDFWAAQSFNLNIPEHYGNCVTCFKKSDRKLLTIARNDPQEFDWIKRMEALYASNGGGDKLRVSFRKYRSAIDMLKLSEEDFVQFTDEHFIPFDPDLDAGGGCGEGCEIGADETDAQAQERWGDDPDLT